MGFIMNMLVIGSQLVAISKVGTLILGISVTDPNYSAWCWTIAVVCGLTALFYCYVSGFGAIVITDFIQFGLSMTGAILLAVYACRQPEVGGLGNMIAQLKNAMPDKLDFAPAIGAAEASEISLLVVIGYGLRGPGRVNRYEGAALLTCFVGYTGYLVSGVFMA